VWQKRGKRGGSLLKSLILKELNGWPDEARTRFLFFVVARSGRKMLILKKIPFLAPLRATPSAAKSAANTSSSN